MTERWTRERRLQHTRNLLLDAAEELIIQEGLGEASLGDIADTVGYTRGAIYSQFGNKEGMFLAVIERHRQRFLDGFTDVLASFQRFEDLDVDELATRWRQLSSADAEGAATLEYELTLFLMRNPQARERVAAQRNDTVRWLSDYIATTFDRMGATPRMPAVDLARVILATNDGITLNSHIDGKDLYRPFLQLVTSIISSSSDAAKSTEVDR
jgi:AcrR family transcriptional regulator